MDVSTLKLGSLKDKVANALAKEKDGKNKKQKKRDNNNNNNNKKDGRSVKNDNKQDSKKDSKKEFKKDMKKDFQKESNKDIKKNKNKAKPETESKTETKNDDPLRREAFELGASEEDLNLVEGLNDGENSEIEFEDSPNNDKSLTEDLSKFMKDIGLGNKNIDDVVIDDDEEDLSNSIEEGDAVEEEQEQEEEEQEQEQEHEQEEKQVEEKQSLKLEESGEKKQNAKSETEKQKEFKKESKKDKITNLQTVITDRLTVPARNDWYNIPLNTNQSADDKYMKPADMELLYEKAQRLIEKENEVYDEEFNKSSSQKRFLTQILTNGTLSDKISALTLLVQEAPLHNLKALDNLYNMCNKKSRTAALQCVDALADLFVNGVLPPDRKLKYFKKQSLSLNSTDQELCLMYFEDYLKKLYFKFVELLENLSHDSILYVRMKIISHLFALLKAKPEQEANLLRLGVNKLGDVDNKVSSKTSYQILLLEQQHPAMKEIISDGVIDVLFRSNNEHHAIYYSIITLNQTILTRREEKLANKLVDAYFALFEKLLIKTDDQNVGKLKESEHQKDGRRKKNFKRGKKGGKSVKNVQSEEDIIEEKNSKMFAAILTGLNRSFPFSNLPLEVFENHLNTLYKITHSSNFNTSVQALILIHSILNKFSSEKQANRYYKTLYESLLDDRLLNSSKQGIYLNLLFKSLKEDSNKGRVLAFIKRICQICLTWLNIGTVSGMLYLLIEIEKSVPELRNLFYNTPMDDILIKKEEEDEAIEELENDQNDEEKKLYDPKKRDPQFANAAKSSIWEIEYFAKHYHPTVQLYAQNLLDLDDLSKEEKSNIAKPDLGLFTLGHFLDRFIYKKAKSKANLKGSSIMQPLGGSHTGNLLVRATGTDNVELPANTEDWISKKVEHIKPEDKIFYQYFITKQEKLMRSKFDKDTENRARADDDDEAGSDLDEATVWDALVKSNPEAEGDESDIMDDELSDLEMGDFSDDNDDDDEASEFSDIKEGGAEDVDDEDEDEEEGLVRLQTIEDLVDDADEEIEGDIEEEIEEEIADEIEDDVEEEVEEEIENEIENEISSDDEDIKQMIEGEDDDEYDNDELEEEVTETRGKKRSKGGKESKSKNKKVKLSSLPTFASAEDYADYLESSDED